VNQDNQDARTGTILTDTGDIITATTNIDNEVWAATAGTDVFDLFINLS